MFLRSRGSDVTTANNGHDVIDLLQQQQFDLIILDENMPGLTGLETLSRLKQISPLTPVIMITKSEEENIMNQAIGNKIADYLIKPVNPSQILLTLKKHIHRMEIITEVTQTSYRQHFGQLSMQISDSSSVDDWKQVYRTLVDWELTLSDAESGMTEMLDMQKDEANAAFAKFIRRNYISWVSPESMSRSAERPPLSPDIMKRYVFPRLDEGGGSLFFIVIVNLRYDHWRTLTSEITTLFDIDEDLYLSILPTATQYARNAIFSGLMPDKISTLFPSLWVDEDSEEGKNLNEEPLVRTHLDRFRRRDTFSYHKINDSQGAERLVDRFDSLLHNDLNVVVLNFVDMLSHARTESKMVRELANNEAAYRSITRSWFRHSAVAELFRRLAQHSCRIVLTTDHGSIRTTKPVRIIGDRNTNTNLRYKLGKNLNCQSKDVFTVKNPHEAQLPSPNLSTSYIFATGNTFFAYPNNYNHYASYYKDTFQHGGISMEEVLIPIVTLTPKKR